MPPLPPPLPPETRTVGQLVAESIRLYGRRFFASLALGLPPAAVAVGLAGTSTTTRSFLLPTVGGLAATVSYVGAVMIAAELRPRYRELALAAAAGVLVFLPFPLLAGFLLLPGIAWLALFGLVVPVVLIERTGLRAGFGRALALARADFVHAAGSLATLAILALLTSFVLFFLLRGQGEATLVAAGFLTVVVVSPLLFLGAALLYFDQAARAVDSRGKRKSVRRRSRADLHHADEPHRPGRADAEVESRPPARGEP